MDRDRALVGAGADRFPFPPVEGLQEGFADALKTAETLTVRDFLAGTDSVPDEDCYFALACVALAGHPVGRALWKFPSQSSGSVQVECPGCETVAGIDGFADPMALPCPVPRFGAARSVPADATRSTAWCLVAAMVATRSAASAYSPPRPSTCWR